MHREYFVIQRGTTSSAAIKQESFSRDYVKNPNQHPGSTAVKNEHLIAVAWLALGNVIGMAAPAQAGSVDITSDGAAVHQWQDSMIDIETPGEGCYHASYPDFVWERITCIETLARVHPVRRQPQTGEGLVTGNGHDYALSATGLITKTVGSFPTVTGVTSEKSVGVALFGGGGILGPNEYSLQINSNANATTSACKGHSGCVVWQQAVYAPDYAVSGQASVFFQYWLIGYGSSCPSGWGAAVGGDCYKNSALATAPDEPITDLSKMKLTATASAGGNDKVTFADGSSAWSVTTKDSVLHLATVWTQSEFNVVGDAGGSRAVFNKGSSILVKVAVSDGSSSTPACAADAGTTGETNNLNLGTCTAAGGTSPSIKFKESN
jgi:hypothetical protein